MTDREKEILAELEAKGIKTGRWNTTEAREVRPQFSGNIMGPLKQLRGVLQDQVRSDIQKLEQLREARDRLKYGGGR